MIGTNTRSSTPAPGRLMITATVRVRHLARVATAVVRQALVRDAQFRSQLWTTLVVGLLEVGAALLPPLLVFGRTEMVNGWRVGEVLAVTGAALLLSSLLATFVAPNQARMTDYIREGELDLLLIRPVPAQLLAAGRWVQPAELWTAASGLGLILLGLRQAGLDPDGPAIMVAVGVFLAGYAATALVWLNLGYLAFWITSAGPLAELLATVLNTARYPLAFYPSAVRVVLLSVLPLGLATTVPVASLRGTAEPWTVLLAWGLVLALAVITRLHWLVGMRRYSSASS